MEVNQVSQNPSANTSTVSIVVYMSRISSTGGDIFNSSPTGWSANVDGQGYSGSITYGHLASGNTVTMLSTTKTITHNSDGTRSLSFSASHNADDSPYLTSASTSGSLTLSTISRTASITSFTVTNITDIGFRINVSTDVTCSQLEYSLNGGSSYTTVAGSFTSKSVDITDKPSSTSYTVKVRVTRSDSGLTTTSGNTSVTTLTQNNFGGFTEF
jgi:hypothetical protein